MSTYYGFSTIGKKKKFAVNDFDLVKTDLYNYLNTRKGERVMNPDFGTIIWGLLFEPLTPEVKNAMMEDITSIVSYDPRIVTNQITLSEYEHGIQIMIELTYVETNQTDTLKLTFDKNASK